MKLLPVVFGLLFSVTMLAAGELHVANYSNHPHSDHMRAPAFDYVMFPHFWSDGVTVEYFSVSRDVNVTICVSYRRNDEIQVRTECQDAEPVREEAKHMARFSANFLLWPHETGGSVFRVTAKEYITISETATS